MDDPGGTQMNAGSRGQLPRGRPGPHRESSGSYLQIEGKLERNSFKSERQSETKLN